MTVTALTMTSSTPDLVKKSRDYSKMEKLSKKHKQIEILKSESYRSKKGYLLSIQFEDNKTNTEVELLFL